jgi:hypothetical protein
VLQHLVQEQGVRHALGLTPSRQQAEWIASFNHPGIEVPLESWTEHVPAQPYNAVVSLGAFEHFARPEWDDEQKVAAYRDFFARCQGWLRPGGRLSLQTIAFGNVDRPRATSSPQSRMLQPHANGHLDGQRFIAFPRPITPAHNLADLLRHEDPLVLFIVVPAGEDATTLLARPVRKAMDGDKTEHADYQLTVLDKIAHCFFLLSCFAAAPRAQRHQTLRCFSPGIGADEVVRSAMRRFGCVLDATGKRVSSWYAGSHVCSRNQAALLQSPPSAGECSPVARCPVVAIATQPIGVVQGSCLAFSFLFNLFQAISAMGTIKSENCN